MGGQQEALAALMGGMGGMGMGNTGRMGGKRGMGAMPGSADPAGGDLQGLPDEIMALLGQIQQQGGDLNNLPAEIVASLQQMQQGQAPQPVDDASAEEITPEPGFVVKTQDVGGRKVFINMVGHPRVAAPGDWSGGMLPESVQLALQNADNLTEAEANTLRFPLSMSPPKQELDKKGEPATTYDCCLNADVIKMCAIHRPLKVFIIELAISWINHKHKQELDPKYKLPKMRYKGDVVESHRIRVDKKPLVTQVKDIPDEPVFPLLTKKPPPPKATAAVNSPAGIPAGHPTQSVSKDGGFSALQSTAGGTNGGTPSGFSFARGGGQCFRQLGPPQLEGKPVEFLTVEVEVPDRLATQLRGSVTAETAAGETARNGGAVSAVLESLRVEVAGQRVWVSAPGCQELEVPLPLAVSQQGATVQLDVSRQPFPVLTLRLPYMSVTQLALAAAAHAPHAPGSLNLSSTTALELD